MRANEFLCEDPHDMPMSTEYSSDWNLSSGKRDLESVVNQINNRGLKAQLKSIPVNKILATQDWLDHEMGGGDPVLDNYADHPVVVYDGEWYHLIDGHHRTHDARLAQLDTIDAYVFYEEEL